MACYPGQPREDETAGDLLSDTEQDYALDYGDSANLKPHSTQVIVRWLEENYHYEEGICLPRSTIYEHYLDFCQREQLHPVNAASFGKIIRQQFSSLTTRRLGTRGKSKYHYFGLGIKPTSLYYNEEYFRRQREGVSRKEPESKKSHPVYPKERPSAVLPLFPDINTLKLSKSVPKDKLSTFMVMYRTHCQRILDSVARANFSEVESFLLHFWQAMPPHLLAVLSSEVVVDLVALCDSLLYSIITSVLIISPLQSFPESLLQEVVKFCGQLGPWLDVAMKGLPETLRNTKQKVAAMFIKTLRRQMALMQLAQAARNALQNDDPLSQLRKDWESLDMPTILAQILYTVYPLDLPHQSLHMIPEFLNKFVSLLEDKTTVEDFVMWVEHVLESCVKPCTDTKSMLQVSRVFLLTWKLFTAKITREFTLQSAPSFGTFHLIHMLMDDYIVHLLESKLEREQQRDYEQKIAQLKDEDAVVADIQVEEQFPSAADAVPGAREPSPSSLADKFPLPTDSSSNSRIFPPFEVLTRSSGEAQVGSKILPPESPLHPPVDLQSTLTGGGSGGPRPLSGGGSLLEPTLLPPSSATPTSQLSTTAPTSTVSSVTPSLGVGGLLSVSHPSTHLPPPLGSSLSAFPTLSPALQQTVSLSGATTMHSLTSQPQILSSNLLQPPSSNAGMTQLMQGLHNIQTVLNPHQSTAAPFTNPLTSMAAGSLATPTPSLPLLPTLPNMYPYNPYGGIPPMPVLPTHPVSSTAGPGRIGGPSFATPSLMTGYPSYVPPAMYSSNQINTTTFSR